VIDANHKTGRVSQSAFSKSQSAFSKRHQLSAEGSQPSAKGISRQPSAKDISLQLKASVVSLQLKTSAFSKKGSQPSATDISLQQIVYSKTTEENSFTPNNHQTLNPHTGTGTGTGTGTVKHLHFVYHFLSVCPVPIFRMPLWSWRAAISASVLRTTSPAMLNTNRR
jgi:hypothetical protein